MVPFVEREVEVLADSYVDPEFGTGVLKVTPAHDPNDFEIGERRGLPAVNVLNYDGTINENGGPFAGMTREEARTALVVGLDEEGLLGEVRAYRHRVGHCDRCGAVIEPWLSEQWWVSMKKLAEPAIEALRNGEITVYPDSWRRETIRWLENIHDWNVSRQLWWGHRLPVWYGPGGEIAATKESPGEDWEQEEDILDTWFSSGLWPFATLGWPEESEDLQYFYPTGLLSTAREIMYLWVARMIMMGLRFRGEVPFDKVNVHSIVLAEDGTKMSKSKGNTIDPIDLFDEYGTTQFASVFCTSPRTRTSPTPTSGRPWGAASSPSCGTWPASSSATRSRSRMDPSSPRSRTVGSSLPSTRRPESTTGSWRRASSPRRCASFTTLLGMSSRTGMSRSLRSCPLRRPRASCERSSTVPCASFILSCRSLRRRCTGYLAGQRCSSAPLSRGSILCWRMRRRSVCWRGHASRSRRFALSGPNRRSRVS